MKPKIIFSTVGFVCLLLAVILPNIAGSRPVQASAPGLAAAAVVAPVTAAARPTLAPFEPGTGQTASAAATAPKPATAAKLPVATLAAIDAPAAPTAAPTLAPLAAPAAASAPTDSGVVLIPSDGSAEQAATAVAVAAAAALSPAANTILDTALPLLDLFIASVTTQNAQQLTGIYVPGRFALPVVDQPAGDLDFVSPEDGTVTQYRRPERFGVTALLAHNYLSGASFFDLHPGQQILLVYGDGQVVAFQVNRIDRYQALEPHNTASDFVDLSEPAGGSITHQQLFDLVYTTPNQLVLQTCISANGEPSWGRIFIVASPL